MEGDNKWQDIQDNPRSLMATLLPLPIVTMNLILLAAFVNTSGHKHDGTAAEGPVIGLIGDPGVATPLNKVVIDNPNNQIEFSVDKFICRAVRC